MFDSFGSRCHARYSHHGSTKQGRFPLARRQEATLRDPLGTKAVYDTDKPGSQSQRKESGIKSSELVCPFCGDHTSWADCKCLNYSRVFNAGNSFASIVQQSTPLQTQQGRKLHKNASFVDVSDDSDSKYLLTPVCSPGRTCDFASDHQKTPSEEARPCDMTDGEELCGSQAMSQLATQLSECVLSPCSGTRVFDLVATNSKGSLSESLSLGYIPDAFPEGVF